MNHVFHSSVKVLGTPLPDFGDLAVKNEPMLFSCDARAAWELGGPITHAFLAAVIDHWGSDDLIVDTRSHMLMPGWWPCIPGWHHDDVPRSRPDGQPDYLAPAYRAEHAMLLVGGDICPTEFALGACELPYVPLGKTIYKSWHPIVDRMVRTGALTSWHAPSNRLVLFDWQTFHQGTRAHASGWRWFSRATRRTLRVPTNEVRRQVQVYLERPMDGW